MTTTTTTTTTESDETIVRGCRDCGEFFSIPPAEQEWLAMRGFKFPMRCRGCRRERRQAAEGRA